MKENLAAVICALFLMSWALSYAWVRRAPDGNEVLVRFGWTLLLPIAGVAAASAVLGGTEGWPWFLVLGGAGALDAAVLKRLKENRRSTRA